MLAAWLELPGAADRIATWSEISGLDLAQLGTTATAEEITDTAVTQPLVVAATLLAYEELTRRGTLAGKDIVVAGHSVGEIAARSEEHTSELQSPVHLVCRLLLEKKKKP